MSIDFSRKTYLTFTQAAKRLPISPSPSTWNRWRTSTTTPMRTNGLKTAGDAVGDMVVVADAVADVPVDAVGQIEGEHVAATQGQFLSFGDLSSYATPTALKRKEPGHCHGDQALQEQESPGAGSELSREDADRGFVVSTDAQVVPYGAICCFMSGSEQVCGNGSPPALKPETTSTADDLQAWRSGYLGLEFHDGGKIVRRAGREADLSGSRLGWEILNKLARSQRSRVSVEGLSTIWNDVGRTDDPTKENVSNAVYDLNKRIKPLGIRAKCAKNLGYTLVELPPRSAAETQKPAQKTRRSKQVRKKAKATRRKPGG